FASQLQSNRIRILAITSSTRWADLSDIPTIAEVTGSDFDMGSWVTIFAPAGTPAEIAKRFAEEATRAVQDPEVQKQLLNVGAVAVGGTPETAIAFFKSENEKWAETIRISGAKP